MMKLTGLIAAPLTAYKANGEINCEVIADYATFLNNNGVSGVFINGTTGEGFSLSQAERKAITEAWVNESPKELKKIVHVAHTSVVDSIELARHAESIGADAFASMAPLFFKPGSVEQLVDSMAEIAAAAPSLPFYFYHMPSMSGVNFGMFDFLKVAEERIPNLAGIKFTYENLMDFELCRAYKDGKYDMLHGRDETLICALAFGARGAVGSTYNFMAPLYVRLTEAFDRGDLDEARRLQRASIEVIQILIESGQFFSAAKAVMKTLGIDLGPVRSPLVDLEPEAIERLEQSLKDVQFSQISCS
jgi:N-acetylneuraminate lyase